QATSSLDRLAEGKTGVISWCPSCHVQFTETTIPTIEKMRGARPFEMTPFMLFLQPHLDRLRPLMTRPVPLRVALHRHPGIKGVTEAGVELLRMVPGVKLVDLDQPAAGVDALAVIYHVDYREFCAHERDWPFRVVNVLEIVGASMGLDHAAGFKRLKIMQDADAIVADCKDMLAARNIDPALARQIVVKAMLNEQPLPLGR